MKIIVAKNKRGTSKKFPHVATNERTAIRLLTAPPVSLAYRKAIATNTTVAYISRGSVIEISDGKRNVVCKVAAPLSDPE